MQIASESMVSQIDKNLAAVCVLDADGHKWCGNNKKYVCDNDDDVMISSFIN